MYGQPAYYPNPALQTAQQRLQMMEAQYPQFANPPAVGYPQTNGYTNQPQQSSPAAPLLKGRPVSNEEEANAAMIDFDGSMFVFPDKAHGKIYTKQLGMDGNIIFLRYSLDPGSQAPAIATTPNEMGDYVKKDYLEKQLVKVRSQLSALEQRLPVQTKPTSKGGTKE